MHRKYFFKSEPQRDRRTSCRYTVDRECTIRCGGVEGPALLLDVSSTGTRIVHRERLAPKSKVTLRVAGRDLEGEVQNVSSRGIIRKVYVIGIRLLEVWPEKTFAELLKSRKP
jgi:hypothetical protein